MYCPAHFQEDQPATLISLIEQFPLYAIVANGPSGLGADHAHQAKDSYTVAMP